MPKKKTRKAVAKRFKITASGLAKFHRAGGSHLMGGKSRKRKRSLRRRAVLGRAASRRIF